MPGLIAADWDVLQDHEVAIVEADCHAFYRRGGAWIQVCDQRGDIREHLESPRRVRRL
jgi:hypothetical protein